MIRHLSTFECLVGLALLGVGVGFVLSWAWALIVLGVILLMDGAFG